MDGIEMEALKRGWRYGPGTDIKRHSVFRPPMVSRLGAAFRALVARR